MDKKKQNQNQNKQTKITKKNNKKNEKQLQAQDGLEHSIIPMNKSNM